MHFVGTIALVIAFAGVLAGGVALFVIARQDDSRTGQFIGAASIVVGLAGLGWLLLRHS